MQGLRGPFDASTPEVVRRFVAVQAQEFVPAQWGLAARLPRERRPGAASVAAAIDEGEILRTHVLRPTWHFLHRDEPPHDLWRRCVEWAAKALHPQPQLAQRRDIHRYVTSLRQVVAPPMTVATAPITSSTSPPCHHSSVTDEPTAAML